ncbi:alkylation response protein AidB-like acyl-CoA dehydrogenase [Microbacterium trichothecenolyticum]|uniref:acyl-CoA dehydrogenase n=1 Tax=Microbacterium trichothecenolyticum TaxID=69370 RepID=UPI00285E5340|nr:acyl-CoA dehydrogenase [Microbacterium trichothecenolyticum]MDR7112255.1 alkylation response protein AidB-like acyl-CoA dehydrogenase [Microbacterium trichothecenolyticum]
MNEATSTVTDAAIDWDAFVPREETQAIVEASRDHFAALFSPDDLRRTLDGGARPDVWDPLVDHGYTLIGLPEELDGLGTLVDLTALLEEAGRALLPAPLLTHAMAAQLLLVAGLLDETTAASRLAFALVRGEELHVFDGADADVAVSVEAAGGASVVRVFTLTGVARAILPAVDPSHPFARLPLDGIPSREHPAPHLDVALAAPRTCVAADLVGVAARGLDGAIAHALGREQFGRPIGSFQGVKHQLADLYVLLERARSLTLGSAVAAASARDSGEASRLSRLAKATAADAAARSVALQTQLLGAMGLTFESDSPLAVRRARHTIPLLGGPGQLYAAVAAESLGGAR